MASPCVVLVDTPDHELGAQIGRMVMEETLRIESKFSRYRPSVVTSINEKAGDCAEVDPETADLIDYAASCYELSDGAFDITSGALRRIWRFDGSGAVPTPAQVNALLGVIGWHRVSWRRPQLRLAPGMEIDFGGIGKEYAVDRAMLLVQTEIRQPAPCLINLGGDLRVSGPRRDGRGWRVGIEDAERTGATAGLMEFTQGAVATSGDTYRYVLLDGVRHGHVLDPRTGRPVPDAPRSVTVHAATCSEAGLLAKLALLSGADAEDFLRREGARAWCYR
jgi:thiamine biosynthesis lipoprotein